jgi:hypothetical protein
LGLLTQTDLIPSPSPNIKNYAIKKSVQRINSSINGLQFESTATNQIVPAEKKLHGAVQRNVGRVNSDGALGEMIPKITIFSYKDYAVSTKNGLQLPKHAGRK